MKIIAHRGYWKETKEKNTVKALIEAISLGYGIETDVRDYLGKLVISHNVADEYCEDLSELFSRYQRNNYKEWIALNVKADGIQGKVMDLVQKYKVKNYFLFDMSIPEMVVYKKNGLPFYTRHSDIEHQCVLYDDAKGVWLDSFYKADWITIESIDHHLSHGKYVCMISPEIHGYSQYGLWSRLKDKKSFLNDEHILLCTDLVDQAKEYFEL